MSLFKKLAVLGGAAEAARRYAQKNPDKAAGYVDKAADFVDKQTKGKYKGHISGVAGKVKGVAGVNRPTYGGPTNGSATGYVAPDRADDPKGRPGA